MRIARDSPGSTVAVAAADATPLAGGISVGRGTGTADAGRARGDFLQCSIGRRRLVGGGDDRPGVVGDQIVCRHKVLDCGCRLLEVDRFQLRAGTPARGLHVPCRTTAAPPILLVHARFPLARPRLARDVAVHLLAATAFLMARAAALPRARPRRRRIGLLDLYLLRGVAGPFIAILLAVGVAMMLERALRLIRELAAAGADLGYFLPLLAQLAPYYLTLAIPASFLDALVLLVFYSPTQMPASAQLADGADDVDLLRRNGKDRRPLVSYLHAGPAEDRGNVAVFVQVWKEDGLGRESHAEHADDRQRRNRAHIRQQVGQYNSALRNRRASTAAAPIFFAHRTSFCLMPVPPITFA